MPQATYKKAAKVPSPKKKVVGQWSENIRTHFNLVLRTTTILWDILDLQTERASGVPSNVTKWRASRPEGNLYLFNIYFFETDYNYNMTLENYARKGHNLFWDGGSRTYGQLPWSHSSWYERFVTILILTRSRTGSHMRLQLQLHMRKNFLELYLQSKWIRRLSQ